MLKEFKTFPFNKNPIKLKKDEHLFILLNMLLDSDEKENMLCESCKSEQKDDICIACGGKKELSYTNVNESFDQSKFLKLKGV